LFNSHHSQLPTWRTQTSSHNFLLTLISAPFNKTQTHLESCRNNTSQTIQMQIFPRKLSDSTLFNPYIRQSFLTSNMLLILYRTPSSPIKYPLLLSQMKRRRAQGINFIRRNLSVTSWKLWPPSAD
jgi:hypothetical protein